MIIFLLLDITTPPETVALKIKAVEERGGEAHVMFIPTSLDKVVLETDKPITVITTKDKTVDRKLNWSAFIAENFWP